jgi:mono/diheme cytochrome c family protein
MGLRGGSRVALLTMTFAVLRGIPSAQGADMQHVDPTFEHWCLPCHGSGLYKAGTLGLEVKYQGKLPALLQQRTDLTRSFVKSSVRLGIKSMPPFRKTEITDAELDALAKYLAKH